MITQLPQTPNVGPEVPQSLWNWLVELGKRIRALIDQANNAVPSAGGDMTKEVYDTDDDGVVDAAASVPWSGVTDPPAIPTQYTDEMAQDAAASMITGGTHTGITATYNDDTGTLNLALSAASLQAWVNFDGTKDASGASSTSNTNRLIRASGNVSSVLRNSAGDYTVSFTNALPDANYSLSGTHTAASAGSVAIKASSAGSAPTLMTASACRIITNGTADANTIVVNFFR